MVQDVEDFHAEFDGSLFAQQRSCCVLDERKIPIHQIWPTQNSARSISQSPADKRRMIRAWHHRLQAEHVGIEPLVWISRDDRVWIIRNEVRGGNVSASFSIRQCRPLRYGLSVDVDAVYPNAEVAGIRPVGSQNRRKRKPRLESDDVAGPPDVGKLREQAVR